MENCDSPVKITVGGKEWYYQQFYKADGKPECVRLYDSGGDFVREYRSLNRLTDSLAAMVRKEKKAELAALEHSGGLSSKIIFGITFEEKKRDREIITKRLSELLGHMTVKEFSEKIGIHENTLRGYLMGAVVPNVFVIKRIAKRCGVSIDWILGNN